MVGAEDKEGGGPGVGGGAVGGDDADGGGRADDGFGGAGVEDVAGELSVFGGVELAVVAAGGDGLPVEFDGVDGCAGCGVWRFEVDFPFAIADEDFAAEFEDEVGEADLAEGFSDTVYGEAFADGGEVDAVAGGAEAFMVRAC